MPISATRQLMSGSWGSPKIDIKSPTLYTPLWRPDMVAKGGLIVNGTGLCTGSPLYLAVGANTVTVTQAGTFTVTMPEGGTVATGTMTVTGSPVTISAGIPATVTTTGATGNITCTVSNVIRSKDKNNYALTISGSSWTSKGQIVDGVDDYIDCGSLSFERTNPFSILAWIKFDTVDGEQIIISKQETGAPYQGWCFLTNATQFGLHMHYSYPANSLMVMTNQNVDDSTWRYLGMTYDGSSTAAGTLLYLAGAVQTPVVVSDTLSDTIARAETLQISGRGNGTAAPAKGSIGEVLVYSRALSAIEIMRIYQTTKWRYS